MVGLLLEGESDRVHPGLAVGRGVDLWGTSGWAAATVVLTVLFGQFLEGLDLLVHFLEALNREFLIAVLGRAQFVIVDVVLGFVIENDRLFLVHFHLLWSRVLRIFFLENLV